jgi:hypothetical protein
MWGMLINGCVRLARGTELYTHPAPASREAAPTQENRNLSAREEIDLLQTKDSGSVVWVVRDNNNLLIGVYESEGTAIDVTKHRAGWRYNAAHEAAGKEKL